MLRLWRYTNARSGVVPRPRTLERSIAGEAVLRGRGDESRFQRWRWRCGFPGALPQAGMKAAPLALRKLRL